MSRVATPTMESLRWENDENLTSSLDQSNNLQLRRTGLLHRPLHRMPLKEITHLFPIDAPSSRKWDTVRNRSSGVHGPPAYAPNRKRRACQASSLQQTDRQVVLLRKFR